MSDEANFGGRPGELLDIPRPINRPIAPLNHDLRDGGWHVIGGEETQKSPALLLAESSAAAGWALLIVAGMFIAQSCAREHDQREIGCAIRWSHAATVSDSLSTAARCGSTGLPQLTVKR